MSRSDGMGSLEILQILWRSSLCANRLWILNVDRLHPVVKKNILLQYYLLNTNLSLARERIIKALIKVLIRLLITND
jgi:hypothetical protein